MQIYPEGTPSDYALKKTKSEYETVAGDAKQVVPVQSLPNKRSILYETQRILLSKIQTLL